MLKKKKKVSAASGSVVSFSDESSDSDDSEEEKEVLIKTLSLYNKEYGKTRSGSCDDSFLKGKDSSCLICLSGIRRVQAVWSCKLCYKVFHLVCIQQWAKDGVLLRTSASVLSEELFPGASIWSCPACRGDYSKSDTPKEYRCFCGRKVNPTCDPWLLAHTCGEVCGRDLQPSSCGHQCLALCHPGPCPPCPKIVQLRCHCGQSAPRPERCGSEGWTCGRVCRQPLTCGLHLCEQNCHSGSCGPCEVRTMVPCRCGGQTERRSCSESSWTCGQVCGKMLSCGRHSCAQVCHSGDCGACPLQTNRTCPCGKQRETDGDCSAPVACCGDTCSKPLSCGRHTCVRQCHVGDCGGCLQHSQKTCRCGGRTKSVLCGQDFLCDVRCQKLRQCGRHQCRRKCCEGNCPTCEQTCGRQMGCKNHKCSAPCHSGRCYPCVQLVSVSCACGKTHVSVACGRERSIKPPRCRQPCLKSSLCHHSNPHHCHEGNCPPCRKRCGQLLSCGHQCEARCHATPYLIHKDKPVAPWVQRNQTLVVADCPPCMAAVSQTCVGGHEAVEVPCSQAAPYHCGQLCGRLLPCGNHKCTLACHQVEGAVREGEAGDNCSECMESCSKVRHKDCRHRCPLPCHSGNCPLCEVKIKFSCHCSSILLYINCSKWCESNAVSREKMRTCHAHCPKLMSCGHVCSKSCHDGPCSRPSQCIKKVSVHCSCHRIKREKRCNEQVQVSCDVECDRRKKEALKESARAAEEDKLKKEKEEKAILEDIERQLRPRKRKRRNKLDTEDVSSAKTTGYNFLRIFVFLLFVCLTVYFVSVIFTT